MVIMKTDLGRIEKWIKEAWEKLAEETNKSRWVQWTEAAAITYPLYYQLERLRNKHNVDPRIIVIPQFRFTVPVRAECGNETHYKGYERKERAVYYDLAIVRFEKGTPTLPTRGMLPKENWCFIWCFKPRPLVLFEAKFIDELGNLGEDFEKDFKKLEKAFGWKNNAPKRAYLCIRYRENGEKLTMKLVPRGSESKLKHIRVAEIVAENKRYKPYIWPYKEWRKIRFRANKKSKRKEK